MTKDLHYLTASEALARFRARELSPVELMQATIDRMEAIDDKVNALPIRFFDEALEKARRTEAGTRAAAAGRAPWRAYPWPSRTRSRSPASRAPRAR